MSTVTRGNPKNREAGAEPIPGYRLIEPLGQGGFGEVWKCEAPGGVFKAIKFVSNGVGSACPATQELEALQRVKTLRHPFILSLDRLEAADEQLLIIMELADNSLEDLYRSYRAAGHPGVPREELLSYLLEAAEALDWMNFEHGLQHLDVKPHNLFLVSNHVKVADFGLVSSLGEDGTTGEARRQGGVTPLYSAPELLRGSLSRHSDQYSLAVVYQQLLTGTLPFWHTDVYELMMQHLGAAPDLSALPEQDRPVIARALSKVPEQRYPSCLEFLQALLGGDGKGGLRQSGMWRRVLLGQRPEGTTTPTGASEKAGDIPAREPPSKIAATTVSTPSAPTPVPASPLEVVRPAPSRSLPRLASPMKRAMGAASEQTALVASGHVVERGATKPVPCTGSVPGELMLDDHSPRDQGMPSGGVGPAPTAVSLPGYRFQSCIGQGLLGDVWRAEDSAGRPRRALCLLNFVRYDARLIAHLQALRDPALPSTEVHWSPAERLVMLTESYEKTLRERFDECRAKGLPGIPRADMLRLLRSVAEALDALYARHGLQHLGINPRNLLVDGERLQIADFGIIPLVWLPTGQSAAAINNRYAAPELFEHRPSRTADQFSLALIFTEMMTGIHPRPQRPSTNGSGLHRRPGAGNVRSGVVNGSARIDLDLLSATDRAVVLKALSADPERRYESCTAFVEALEAAERVVARKNLYHRLPLVIPYTSLLGEPPPPGIVLPPVAQLVTELTRAVRGENDSSALARTPAGARRIQGSQNTRYLVQPDGAWEYRCPLLLYPGSMPLKVEGFRHHWRAQLAKQEGDAWWLHIEVEPARGERSSSVREHSLMRSTTGYPERNRKPPRRVEVEIRVDARPGPQTRLTELTVRVRCIGEDQEQPDLTLAAIAPKVFESIRLLFQVAQEQRMRERWLLTEPLQVYPVEPDLELGEVIAGRCQNISFGGVRFLVPKQPPADMLYLHLHDSPAALAYAILARVARVQETAEGFEIGAVFPGSGK
jgi:serine/threonine protein kinase